LAIAIATIVMMFSYFPYAAGFAVPEGEPEAIDVGLVGIGLVVAPFVFLVLGLVSGNPATPRRVLQSMGLLLLLGLGVGLLSPALGATAGFAVGGALTLNPPDLPDVLRTRLWAVLGVVLYTFVLQVVSPPAGVFTGALVPLVIIGFADEYAFWRQSKTTA
jgi:hypothetical protein